MIKAVRYHDISTGHRVYGHESKCKYAHGHNYRVHFYCEGDLDAIGRVIDFSVIKSTLCMWLEDNYDHKFLLWKDDPWCEHFKKFDPDGLVIVDFNPTAENIAKNLVEVVAPKLLQGSGVMLKKCIVDETRKCSAEYEI